MTIRHKHRAKRLLRVATEQETVDRALDAVLAEEIIVKAHAKVRAVGGFVDAFQSKR